MAQDVHTLLQPRVRKYNFPLTPLADAMFQLLIFFMLSASVTPYSLMTLRSGPPPPGGGRDTTLQPPPPGTPEAPPVMWSVQQGEIVASGQRFGFTSLPALTQALRDAKTPRVVLVATPAAQVQDLVRVLEALSSADINAVQIIQQGPL